MRFALQPTTNSVYHAKTWLCVCLISITLGCEYVRPTMNAPLPRWEPAYGYRFANLPPSVAGSTDNLFIIASFSGGGARASAFSYGVLRELAQWFQGTL
jgi:NTE family protein